MGTRRRRVSVIYFISKLVKWDDLHMEIISNPTQVEIKKAAQALKDGHLVAFPTETVYGLGADATNENAVSRVYSVKGRPTDHPLIVHIASINQLEKWSIDVPRYAIDLAEAFWPGPLTLILKRSELAKDFITGGQENIGLRVPNQPVALELLRKFEELAGHGIAAPSANRFGAVSPTTVNAVNEELNDYLSDQDLILGGQQCEIGVESTIINCTEFPPQILRPGAVTQIMIESIIGIKLSEASKKKQVKAAGFFRSHYAPKAKVTIGEFALPGEGYIAMNNYKSLKGVIRLASPSNIEEFARDFYAALRAGDQMGLSKIVVTPPIGTGLALAIRDRLNKASN
jgi:L-threonylcarbamoyladenylate synthase